MYFDFQGAINRLRLKKSATRRHPWEASVNTHGRMDISSARAWIRTRTHTQPHAMPLTSACPSHASRATSIPCIIPCTRASAAHGPCTGDMCAMITRASVASAMRENPHAQVANARAQLHHAHAAYPAQRQPQPHSRESVAQAHGESTPRRVRGVRKKEPPDTAPPGLRAPSFPWV